MSKQFHLYQTKGRLIFALFCVLLFAAGSWWGVAAMMAKISKIKGEAWLILLLIIGIAVGLTFFSIKAVWMLMKSGEPIATLNPSGIALRGGQLLPWQDIEELTLESVEYIVTLRSDLKIQLRKGKKKLPYVDLTQERLADLVEEVQK